MAYKPPPWFTKNVFNPIAMRFGLSGTYKLTVVGRTSGERREVPVLPIEHDGARYLVSTRGESAWVKNVRAAGQVELTRKGVSETLGAVEVPVGERQPVLDTYQRIQGKMVAGYFKDLPDPADHPTFRLEVPAAAS
jgi:deazaflavin-dependent oxidoreductase (nitroreductase family)